jgi:hypothetical protein
MQLCAWFVPSSQHSVNQKIINTENYCFSDILKKIARKTRIIALETYSKNISLKTTLYEINLAFHKEDRYGRYYLPTKK